MNRSKTSRTSFYYLLTLTTLLFSSACAKDDESPIEAVDTASQVVLLDADNAGNETDLRVSFRVGQDESEIGSYRIIITKSSLNQLFDLETALAVPSDRYISITPSGEDFRMNLPLGHVDSDGDAITEEGEYRAFVLSMSKDETVATSAVSGPSNTEGLANEDVVLILVESLNSATGGIAIDSDGNIFAADIGPIPNRGGNSVFKISPAGQVSTFAVGQGLNNPSGNAFDSQGNLYQSNLAGGLVLKITPTGSVSTFAQGLVSPVGIVIDGDDNLYVTNCGNNTISKITPDGTVSLYASSNLFNCPNGIGLDSDGNLYVANFSNGGLLKVTPAGDVSLFVTIPGGNNGHIAYKDDLFYVAARGGNRIYTLDTDGNLTVFAGSGQRGTTEADALNANFTLPNDLGFSPDGKYLYFNHAVPTNGTNNSPSVIRKIVLKR